MNINIRMDEELYKGDGHIVYLDVDEDISAWKIRAEFYDNSGNSVKLATDNVTGGSDDQITISHPSGTSTWTIEIFCPNEGTTSFDNNAYLEIQGTDEDDRVKTLYQIKIELIPEQITWDEVS